MWKSVEFNSNEFDYSAARKQFSKDCNFLFPLVVSVKSHRTGKVVKFERVSVNDPLFDQDGWDGEQMVYRAVSEKYRDLTLVLYRYG